MSLLPSGECSRWPEDINVVSWPHSTTLYKITKGIFVPTQMFSVKKNIYRVWYIVGHTFAKDRCSQSGIDILCVEFFIFAVEQ